MVATGATDLSGDQMISSIVKQWLASWPLKRIDAAVT
jgi:hypothetical protein